MSIAFRRDDANRRGLRSCGAPAGGGAVDITDWSSDLSNSRAGEAAYQDPRANFVFQASGAGAYVATDVLRVFSDGAAFIGGARTTLLEHYTPDGASWINANTPILTTGQSDPIGGTTAVLVEDDSGAAAEGRRNVTVTTTATQHTNAWIFKKDLITTRLAGGALVAATAWYFTLNTSAGTLTPVGSGGTWDSLDVLDMGDWWLVVGTVTTDNGRCDPYTYPALGTSAGVISGAAVGSVTLWGQQLEVAAYPGGLIRAAGAATTRPADVATMTVDAALETALRSASGFEHDLWPLFSSSDAHVADARAFDIGGGRLQCYFGGTSGNTVTVSNGAGYLATATVTGGWSRYDQLRIGIVSSAHPGTHSISVENITQATGPFTASDSVGTSTAALSGQTLTLGGYNGGATATAGLVISNFRGAP